jgi:hypothetical protein
MLCKGLLTFGYHICEVLLFAARRIVYLSCHIKLEAVLKPWRDNEHFLSAHRQNGLLNCPHLLLRIVSSIPYFFLSGTGLGGPYLSDATVDVVMSCRQRESSMDILRFAFSQSSSRLGFLNFLHFRFAGRHQFLCVFSLEIFTAMTWFFGP